MSAFDKILSCLPSNLAFAVTNSFKNDICCEIRLKRNNRIVISTPNGIKIVDAICTSNDMDGIIKNLCGSSLYTHEETIKRGFISFDDGVRVGVCGTAVTVDDRVQALRTIDSLNIRIPAMLPSLCAPLLSALEHYKFRGGVLVYSPPGVGKTTLLRHTALALSTRPYLKRVALIDSRGELSVGCENAVTLDIYKYYPPKAAIEMAIRTMTPDIIICDEIGGEDEEKALLSCVGKGVTVIASSHGDSIDGIMKTEAVYKLHKAGLFVCYCLITRDAGGMKFKFTQAGEIEL